MGVSDAVSQVGGGGIYPALKRALDVLVALVALIILAIPLLVVLIVVRLNSPGPVLLKQERVGRQGRPFTMYKVRTMYEDAWDLPKYLTPAQIGEWEREHKVEGDPRITSVGRVLRRTSLDEVPQFANVLQGAMSIVGPRPITVEELAWYGDETAELLSAKPGVTGYWQVMARNDADYVSGKRQEMELYYVRHLSPGLDARIFLKTFTAVFRGTGM